LNNMVVLLYTLFITIFFIKLLLSKFNMVSIPRYIPQMALNVLGN